MIGQNEFYLRTDVQRASRVTDTLSALAGFASVYRSTWFWICVLGAVSLLPMVIIPVLMGQAVDCYLVTSGGSGCWLTVSNPQATYSDLMSGLVRLSLLIVGLYLVNAVFTSRQIYLVNHVGHHMLRDIRRDLFLQIHRLTLRYYNDRPTGDLMSRITDDTHALQQVLGFGLHQVIHGVMLTVFILGAMLIQNWFFALLVLLTLPLIFLISHWLSSQARKSFREARQEIGAINANLQENIASAREIRSFNREADKLNQFQMNNVANRDANLKARAYSSALTPTLSGLNYITIAVISGLGSLIILSGGLLAGTTVTLGLIITFIALIQQLHQPIQQIAMLWANLQSALAGAERIFSVLDEEPDMRDLPWAVAMPPIRGQVQFKGVFAAYKENIPVLHDINFMVEPGETVAIVGPTGAGKTTLVNLIPRLWDVTAGRITIDGYEIDQVSRQSLRRQIGMVLQDPFFFHDTILNNIRYGREEATDEEVIEAARQVGADAFIRQTPEGYETVLGERGEGASHGQRQLLALARVLLSDPRILILDEATRNIDTQTERQIQKAIEQLLHGRTSFVIAHRLHTIKNADRILVLENGRIVEEGTHQTLLAAGGRYYDLYMSHCT